MLKFAVSSVTSMVLKITYAGCLKTKLDSTIVTKFSTIRSIHI